MIPVLLSPGEEINNLADVYIRVQFYVLVNGRKIEFSPIKPTIVWQNDTPTWSENEEDLVITYNLPILTQDEMDAYGDLRYYGFTAMLYYNSEPMDCISSPSALILHQQRLESRNMRRTPSRSSLLPDDGLDDTYTEEATPFSEFLEGIAPAE